jgi:hypothetical protein
MKIMEHINDETLHFLEESIIHGSISGLDEDDHTQYLLADGTRELSADWDAGSHKITAQEFAGWGIVPVGGVTPWLKDLTNTPALPDGFVECNGQVLSDEDSVYDGVTLPNLNGYGGQPQRFLRGALTSGGTGGSDTHVHGLAVVDRAFYQGYLYYTVLKYGTDTTNSASNLPRYYETVMVMRIK